MKKHKERWKREREKDKKYLDCVGIALKTLKNDFNI
jgi:hypothetical protein